LCRNARHWEGDELQNKNCTVYPHLHGD
jgi:hypothetical protein